MIDKNKSMKDELFRLSQRYSRRMSMVSERVTEEEKGVWMLLCWWCCSLFAVDSHIIYSLHSQHRI